MAKVIRVFKYGAVRPAAAWDVYKLLGLSNDRLPVEGMPERIINGVRVYVRPLPAGEPGQRQSLRVMAICDCGRHVAVGRLHQHKCK
jgi:hypothetical protein